MFFLHDVNYTLVSGIQWEYSSRSLVRHADIVVRNIPMAYINDNGRAQIQTMLYLQLPLISLNLVLVQANHKEDEPQEKNYYGSPTRGGLPIVAQPIQGTGTSDGHSTS